MLDLSVIITVMSHYSMYFIIYVCKYFNFLTVTITYNMNFRSIMVWKDNLFQSSWILYHKRCLIIFISTCYSTLWDTLKIFTQKHVVWTGLSMNKFVKCISINDKGLLGTQKYKYYNAIKWKTSTRMSWIFAMAEEKYAPTKVKATEVQTKLNQWNEKVVE